MVLGRPLASLASAVGQLVHEVLTCSCFPAASVTEVRLSIARVI